MLEIVPFTLGPAQTNAYLVADPETTEAIVIDPSWDGHLILKAAHPSPYSVNSGFFGCKHFSKTNEYLTKTGQTPIDWILTSPTTFF